MPIAQASLELWSSANDAALIDDVSTTGGARSTVARSWRSSRMGRTRET
jgi:hypothetical protein